MVYERCVQISGNECTTIIFSLTNDTIEYLHAMCEPMQITLIKIIGQFKYHLPNNARSAKQDA